MIHTESKTQIFGLTFGSYSVFSKHLVINMVGLRSVSHCQCCHKRSQKINDVHYGCPQCVAALVCHCLSVSANVCQSLSHFVSASIISSANQLSANVFERLPCLRADSALLLLAPLLYPSIPMRRIASKNSNELQTQVNRQKEFFEISRKFGYN